MEKGRRETEKCVCGSQANLHHIIKLGREGDLLVTVHDVPTYICTDCDMKFSNGSDNLQFAERVREAARLGMDEIRF